MKYDDLKIGPPTALCLECGMPPCNYHPHREPYTHHRSGCPSGVRAMPRARRRTPLRLPPAFRPVPEPGWSATQQATLSRFRPRREFVADMARGRQVITAHALAWALGAPRLDTHAFNLHYFPTLGTYQCRALYTATRAELGVRWPA